MPAYILRFAGTNELVGFYAAASEFALFSLIDEETDPGEFEYAIVERGFGIEFITDGDPVKALIGDLDNIEEALCGAAGPRFTSGLSLALAGHAELEWRRFYQD